jgi:hypothetical protein
MLSSVMWDYVDKCIAVTSDNIAYRQIRLHCSPDPMVSVWVPVCLERFDQGFFLVFGSA